MSKITLNDAESLLEPGTKKFKKHCEHCMSMHPSFWLANAILAKREGNLKALARVGEVVTIYENDEKYKGTELARKFREKYEEIIK